MKKTDGNKSLGLKSTSDAIEFLRHKGETDTDFVALLLESLRKAKAAAKVGMNDQLFAVLAWPTDFPAYLEYLVEFSLWAPHQSDNPGWADPETGFSQEVYDHLCHFYYLIDQPVGSGGAILVQNIDWFSLWLVDYANLWGDFLNTPESFSDEILETFINYSPYFRVQDSMVNGKPNKPGGWQTFNEFFARELNPGLRPIASPEDNTVITMPADSTYRMQYPISPESTITDIWIKKTHQFAAIPELLQDSKYANAFANGTFVHYFLGPYSYHRFHTPVAGMLEECYAVQGLTFLEVNLVDGEFSAPDNAGDDPPPGTNSGDGYEFAQARGIVTIDTSNSPYGDMGIVAVIPVGMCQVSSVNMKLKAPAPVNKGDEFGYFLFGGSDIILLFQEGKAPQIDTCDSYRYYGTDVSTCPNSPK